MLQSNITCTIDKRNYQLRRATAALRQTCAPTRRTANDTRESAITVLVAVLAVRGADRAHRDRLRKQFKESFGTSKDDNITSSLNMEPKIVFFLPKFATSEENLKASDRYSCLRDQLGRRLP
jgi:hypothetical protein